MKRIIFLLFIVHLGFPHLVFSTVDNLFAENIKKIRTRAKAGDSEAQFMLGKLYYYGFSVEPNYKEAIKWFRAAAIQGHPSSQFLLGEAYENGKGLQKDYMQAAAWYKQAAFQGNYLAIHSLSYLLAHGLGVHKNFVEAYAWNKLLTGQGWDRVKSLRIELEKIMSQEQLNQAQILSIELKKKIREPLQ